MTIKFEKCFVLARIKVYDFLNKILFINHPVLIVFSNY